MKFDMCYKNIKNIQLNENIFKNVVMLIGLVKVVALCYNLVCSQILSLNFSPLNNILGPYIKKNVQQKFYLTKILKDM